MFDIAIISRNHMRANRKSDHITKVSHLEPLRRIMFWKLSIQPFDFYFTIEINFGKLKMEPITLPKFVWIFKSEHLFSEGNNSTLNLLNKKKILFLKKTVDKSCYFQVDIILLQPIKSQGKNYVLWAKGSYLR